MTARVIACVLIVLASVSLVPADEYQKGHVTSDGYTYQGNGVWAHGSSYYTRSLYQAQYPGTWRCGVYYPGNTTYFYQYAPYTYPAKAEAYPDKLPSYSDPDWKRKLLDIAAARDKVEGEIRKGVYDHQYYLQSIQALGLQGNFRWEGYGTIPPYVYGQGASYAPGRAMPYSYEITNYGAQAQTQYGYSYNTIASLYGDTSLNQLFQQAGLLTQNAQRLSGDATAGFQTLVGQEGGNRARVAEILARGQMAHQVLMALQAPGDVKGYSFKFKSGGDVERIPEPSVLPQAQTGNAKSLAAVVEARCIKCHSGREAKGKFDVASYPNLSEDAKRQVWQRLTSPDEKLRMPPPPAQPLTAEELKAFLFN